MRSEARLTFRLENEFTCDAPLTLPTRFGKMRR